jgi:hypothetical protein
MLAAAIYVEASHAQVYKCVDAGGRTVYSQIPCPANTKSETLSRGVIGAPSSAPSGDAAKDAGKSAVPASTADQEKAFQKRAQDQQETAQKDAQKLADAKLKEENCARTRGYMQSLQSGRVSQTNEAGERSFLDDNQIAAELAKAQAQVDQYCSK